MCVWFSAVVILKSAGCSLPGTLGNDLLRFFAFKISKKKKKKKKEKKETCHPTDFHCSPFLCGRRLWSTGDLRIAWVFGTVWFWSQRSRSDGSPTADWWSTLASWTAEACHDVWQTVTNRLAQISQRWDISGPAHCPLGYIHSNAQGRAIKCSTFFFISTLLCVWELSYALQGRRYTIQLYRFLKVTECDASEKAEGHHLISLDAAVRAIL